MTKNSGFWLVCGAIAIGSLGCASDPPPAAASAASTTASSAAAPAATTGDADGDGIPDSADKCPDKKEDGLAPDPKDGCPKAS
jgi:hypothetical protein